MNTYGTQAPCGLGVTTVMASMDFETYSEAGMYYDFHKKAFKTLLPNKQGISIAGAWAYSLHPSTEALCLAYDLKDGYGSRLWVPGNPAPADLLAHIAAGRVVSAFNSFFEYSIWTNVCAARLGWPPLPLESLRDTQAKAQAYSLPKALGKVAEAIEADVPKNPDGKALIKKFCIPRTPTKNDPRARIHMDDEPDDAARFLQYCIDDIRAEDAIAAKVPDLSPTELNLWLLDQKINLRGCKIDRDAVDDLLVLIAQINIKYTAEICRITNGAVRTAKEVITMAKFVTDNGYPMDSVAKEHVIAALDDDALPDICRQVLDIRFMMAISSVAKIPTLVHSLTEDNRARGMFAYHQAHTGRFAGQGVQPQNFPKAGPKTWQCDSCRQVYGIEYSACHCGGAIGSHEWSVEAVETVLDIAKRRSLPDLEAVFPSAFASISGCLRGLFIAADGHELISSDYSAIEAVVLAAMAGEEWRLEVFRTHGKIYEMSAAKVTGIPFEEFIRYKKETGDHHPMRGKIGKVAELASGFGGGLGAWKAFGADKFMSDPEIQENVKRWRIESPNIKKFWYGLQDAAIAAIQVPGTSHDFRGVRYYMRDNILYCVLPSGRSMTYHKPILTPEKTSWGKDTVRITYMGWKSTIKKWTRLSTWGGKLTENVIQAVSRDIFTNAMPKLESAGYPIVLHTHDEMVSEVPTGYGSIAEYETIMADVPEWCRDWPIRADGGWRGKRYRKD